MRNIVVYLFNFLKNPFYFFKKIMYPKSLPFGNDTLKIDIIPPYVYKTFINQTKFIKTLNFINIIGNQKFIPIIYDFDKNKLIIKQEYCGNILDIRYNLPKNWKYQLNTIKNIFIQKNIILTDLQLLDLNPYIVYNICVKNNKIYLIDFCDWEFSNRETIVKLFKNLENSIEFICKCNILTIILYIIYILINRLINSISKKLFKLFNFLFN